MKDKNSEAITSALDRLRAATRELAAGCLPLSTKDAVSLSSVPLTAETLLRYPRWVMPPIAKTPRAKRRRPKSVPITPPAAAAPEDGGAGPDGAVPTLNRQAPAGIENRASAPDAEHAAKDGDSATSQATLRVTELVPLLETLIRDVRGIASLVDDLTERGRAATGHYRPPGLRVPARSNAGLAGIPLKTLG